MTRFIPPGSKKTPEPISRVNKNELFIYLLSILKGKPELTRGDTILTDCTKHGPCDIVMDSLNQLHQSERQLHISNSTVCPTHLVPILPNKLPVPP